MINLPFIQKPIVSRKKRELNKIQHEIEKAKLQLELEQWKMQLPIKVDKQ
jgi:hypothetical protein